MPAGFVQRDLLTRGTLARGSFLAGARPTAAVPPCRSDPHHHVRRMFVITEAVAAASRAAFDRGGKLSAVVVGRFQVKLANEDSGPMPGSAIIRQNVLTGT
jgi:hypothetical protein